MHVKDLDDDKVYELAAKLTKDSKFNLLDALMELAYKNHGKTVKQVFCSLLPETVISCNSEILVEDYIEREINDSLRGLSSINDSILIEACTPYAQEELKAELLASLSDDEGNTYE